MTVPNIIWWDGLDGYNSSTQLTTTRPEVNVAAVCNLTWGAGRFGGNGMQSYDGGGSITKVNLASTMATAWLARACFISSNTGGSTILIGRFWDTSNLYTDFWLDCAAGIITAHAFNGDATVPPVGDIVLGTSDPTKPVSRDVWHWIELRVTYDTGGPVWTGTHTGVIEVWVDGVRIMNVTGTKNNQGPITWIMLNLQSPYARVDDPVVCDGMLGDSRITMSLPSSDAGPNNGTPNSGTNHYSRVNENPGWDGDTSYITMSSNASQKEAFGMAALPLSPTAIYSVQTMVVAEKADAGNASAHTDLKSGATTAHGASKGLLTSYVGWKDRFDTDPNTGAAWTPSAVNAAVPIYVAE